ncbi:Histone-lysine N-methyltransferase ATXR2 [Vitis vinifera]|uniref:Histone-lysine N-methyltransferase ATXR2 n=1 Tax=Vitis vinifera TaxID=29760 RepID=A0A438CQM3_VITVI|nr:Histone-lysine N-methyltransferase ATXR2 [Vitis vinifera]
MESICPIDSQFSREISALLKPPPAHQLQEYFDNLIRTRQYLGLKVKHDGEFGKENVVATTHSEELGTMPPAMDVHLSGANDGVYADSDFGEGELVVKDQMLVGAQHSSNKINCLVCSFCFHFIGSIELQIGRRLYLQGLGVSTSNGCGRETFSHNSHDNCQVDSSEDEDNCYMEEHDELGECASSSSKDKVPLPKGVVESLMNGELTLPYPKEFPLPSAIACSGGCGEAYYCSKLCAEADWESSHSLLCTGEKSESICREALSKFIQHANETNDIFLLAAKVQEIENSSSQRTRKYTSAIVLKNGDLPLLLEAWKPISMGFKKRWWDCIALPDDVHSCDEAAFRAQIKELAFTKVIAGEYGMEEREWGSGVREGYGVGVWKAIRSGWYGDLPLKETFPILFVIANVEDAWVVEVWE